MKKKDIILEYKVFKRYVQHLQFKLLQEESHNRLSINVKLNRNRYYQIDLKVNKNRDNLPLMTNHYKSIPYNIRLQNPTPVLLERLTPMSVELSQCEETEELFKTIEQAQQDSIEKGKQLLRNELKVFLDYFFEKYKDLFRSIKDVFKFNEIAEALNVSVDQIQLHFLSKLQGRYSMRSVVKYQFVRFNRYFCPICNLYMCSWHYSSKNQRVFIESEPNEEMPINIQSIDNFYETDFKPNQINLKDSIWRYHMKNKQEIDLRCAKIGRCGKYNCDNKKRLKKFQIKSIQQLLEFGFENCCFINQILQHPVYKIYCDQIIYIIKNYTNNQENLNNKPQQNIMSPENCEGFDLYSQKLHKITNYQQQYTPCFHEGSCKDADCSCVMCPRYCCCKGKCEKKIKRCDCKYCGYDEKKRKFSCACFNLGFECDPSICKCTNCNNVNLTLGISKQLILGKSLICNGIGLFAAQHFKPYDFIGEYRGNYLLLDEESFIIEQCNMLTGKHYLFEVDDKWQVDGTYYSNYLRFINHATNSSETANCQAIILFSEGRWKIGMLATREIEVGQELYFDYGDKFKTKWLQEFNKISERYFQSK
ncbi:unnamed protein product [Paramecium octaurelia]|uniref:SET domain-containing protein n=1 Tax=Paramecium octaurelia TaxID=43137 RepID=A0A8S1W701_PAROT|nr:unnamed protein product [Paramecium octaurelia]